MGSAEEYAKDYTGDTAGITFRYYSFVGEHAWVSWVGS